MNYIFGSGIVGLLAKEILGPDWTIVPFKRSRFFSWNPSLDDNFIIYDKEIDPFIADLYGKTTIFPYKISWSVAGAIINKYNFDLCDEWARHTFSNNEPSVLSSYMKNRMEFNVYDIRINKLYRMLVSKHINELKEQSAFGNVTEVGDHFFVRNGKRYDFDKIINTIPLDAFLTLKKQDISYFKTSPIHYIHLQTKDLDFEGANQLLICDKEIDFFKVANIAPDRYLFYFKNDVVNYGVYLMNFIRNFDILDGTAVDNALITSECPINLNDQEQIDNVYHVGSYAQWDHCADVSSCILRLLRIYNRNFGKRDIHKL